MVELPDVHFFFLLPQGLVVEAPWITFPSQLLSLSLFFCFLFFAFQGHTCTPEAYGGSQARG